LKAIITVLRAHLDKADGLFEKLTALCDTVDESPDAVMFRPRAKANMDFICLLLNDDIPYTLTIENSLTEASRHTNGHEKKKNVGLE
jgi:hypothetical protein